MSDTDLSSRIRQRREQLGLSQEELAARMGYRSKSSITKLEKGINDLPRAKLEELAAALDTTPAWLMGLVDLPCPPPGFEPLPEMVRVPPPDGSCNECHRSACRLHRLRHPHHC